MRIALDFQDPAVRRRFAALGIGLVLLVHIGIRSYAASKRPVQAIHGEYTHCYSRSLSLLANRGNQRLPLPDDATARPIRQFLDAETNEISPHDWSAYLAARPSQGELGCYRFLDAGRLGELYTAAAVWKVCGIRWSALVYFHIGVSAAACLALMLVSWKVSGRLSAALTAGMIMAFCRLEATLLMRDNNALWLATFGFLAFTYLSKRFSSHWNGPAALVLGIVANLGYLWRPTSLIVAAFLFLVSLVRWCGDARGWRQVILSTAGFLAGAGGVVYFTNQIVNPVDALPKGIFFHIAYFSEYFRANLLEVENSFQIAHDDSKTAADAFAYETTHSRGESPMQYCSPAYEDTCRDMYFAALKHQAFHWVRGIPQTLWQALNSAHSLRYVAPALFLLGSLAMWLPTYDRFTIRALALFYVYYAAVWFGFSPEARHTGLFLIPLCTVGGLAPAVAQDLWRAFRSGAWKVFYAPWVRHAGLVATALVAWAGLCAAAYTVSTNERTTLTEEIVARSDNANDITETLTSPHEFAVHHEAGTMNVRSGYLVEITTGGGPAKLLCKHLRLSAKSPEIFGWVDGGPGSDAMGWLTRTIWWNTFLETRHRLHPGRKHLFFATCLRGTEGGDHRGVSVKVELLGDARITSVKKLDLSDWTSLPISTVMLPGESASTIPYVGGGPTSRTLMRFPSTAEALAELGFSEKHLERE